ncbi:MAG: hypothetical protein KDB40_22335 [Acidimicrobiales bacterium]|nr:hypothetical protein [Acidimicrobiales bacterium]
MLDLLRSVDDLVVLAEVAPEVLPLATVISSDRPRLDFARVLATFFAEEPPRGVHPTAIVAPTVRLGQRVTIGAYAVVEDGVEIGDDSIIGEHVVLRRRCVIGERTRIKPNSVIGDPGFGFEYDGDTPIRIPHVGAVRIGSDVEIGALVSIARGTLDDTVVEDHVKVDDHVFIAHNARIGRGAFVIAGAEVSGSVQIGPTAWIGPQVTIRDQIQIGANAMVGIGAVVTKDVPADVIAVGNPARVLRARD